MKINTPAAVFLLFLLITLAYFNSIRNPFHYDDLVSVQRNPGLTSLSNIKYIIQQKEYFELFGERTYRPVTSAIYIVLKQAFGNNPSWWRLFNLLLHLANCVVLLLLFERLRIKRSLTLLAVAIFAVHTVHTEIFNVVSYNEDLIGGLFCLLSLLTYFKTGLLWRICSLLFYLLSCFTKETFVLSPLLIFIFSWQTDEEFSIKGCLWKLVPFFLLALGFYWINFQVMVPSSSFMKPIYPGGSLRVALQTFAVVLMYYFKLFVWPLGLTPNYEFITYGQFNALVAFSVGCLVLLLLLLGYGLLRKAPCAPYLAWYFIFLLPTSNIIPYGGILAERYLYFPLMGFIVGLLLLLDSWIARLSASKILYGLGLVFIVWLSVLTVMRNAVWSDPIKVWGEALKRTDHQNDFISLTNLASAYEQKGEYEKAIILYQQAIQSDPMWPFTYRNLGRIYWRQNRLTEAREQFELALGRRRGFLELNDYYDLLIDQGALCLKLEDYQAALDYWLKAQKEQPENPRSYFNLRLVYHKLGMKKQADEANERYQSLQKKNLPPQEQL